MLDGETEKAEKRGPLNSFTINSITWCHSEKQKLQVPFGGILLQKKRVRAVKWWKLKHKTAQVTSPVRPPIKAFKNKKQNWRKKKDNWRHKLFLTTDYKTNINLRYYSSRGWCLLLSCITNINCGKAHMHALASK